VVSGRVSQEGGTLNDGVMADGYALTCVTRPLEDCVIKVVDEDELVSAQFADRPSGVLA
jgi:ferredoxin